jgi:hypothetical protein
VSIDSVLIWICDRCGLKSEDNEGWLDRGCNDYCENCREYV